MPYLLPFLLRVTVLWICPIITLLFIVRILLALFSSKYESKVARHPRAHMAWGVFAGLFLIAVWCFFHLAMFPPAWFERRSQRQQILERINAAGGWAALKRDCDSLADTYRNAGYNWTRGQTDSLPPAIAALKPRQVEFHSQSELEKLGKGGQTWFGTNEVVRITIFGAHSTGGHDQPWLGVDVLSGHVPSKYDPERMRSIAPAIQWNYRKITDDIYEFY